MTKPIYTIRVIRTLVLFLSVTFITTAVFAEMQGQGMMKHRMSQGMKNQMSGSDDRIVLQASPMMKEHQKKNMREHLRTVQEIVALIGKKDFETASKTTHEKLGLNEEMKRMCGMFGESFLQMGIAFHESADRLSEVLKTKDMGKAITALDEMLVHCVTCHDTFRH